MKISQNKLKAILLYFAHHTDQRFLGKVKLLKLFYFLDFTHVKIYGGPVTYDTYVKLEHGPVPSLIKNLVDTLEDDIDTAILADTITIEYLDRMHRIKPMRNLLDSDLVMFSKQELKTLESVCKRFYSSNAQSIETASHEESPWKDSAMLDVIPYTMAANDLDCQVSREDIDLLIMLAA